MYTVKDNFQLIKSSTRIDQLVLGHEVRGRLDRVLLEQKKKNKLSSFGLSPRRKLLFFGPPGTGKTMSAAAMANELKLPLYSLVLDSLIKSHLGETASALRLAFDHVRNVHAVYLLDEFDAIGAQRSAQNDVGEMRRVLNSFLILIEQDLSDSIIIAATNHSELLDKALYRRFDDIIRFEKPKKEQIRKLIENRLSSFKLDALGWEEITTASEHLSAAEVIKASEDAAKTAVLLNKGSVTTELVLENIRHRKFN